MTMSAILPERMADIDPAPVLAAGRFGPLFLLQGIGYNEIGKSKQFNDIFFIFGN